uniref:Uncharacterized protein n=1 Tax=Microviridae sp. ctX0F7 TaxID=2824999 RepID=A0A8S5NX98_9VIRU|nr:MAG TPA: hypothetical protein [Microviridae sp. ctX0F7]
MPDVETPSLAWLHIGFCCKVNIKQIMPKAYLSGESPRGTGTNCRAGLSAICVRARFVCVRVIAGHVCTVGRVPLGIDLRTSYALMYKTSAIHPAVFIIIAPLWRTARAASQEI